MGTLDRAVFHPVDIQAMEESVSTSVLVLSMNVITSRGVVTGEVYVLIYADF